MLIILFGVSCVGKSTLIQELKNKFCWFSVPTYMTRPLRNGEAEKVSISNQVFSQLESENYFICVNSFFGNKYGTPKKEIEIAVKTQEQYWVLDFSITRRHLLKKYKYISLIILPQNEEQLIEQANKSNRIDRLESILEEYKNHYVKYYQKIDDKSSDIVVINMPNKVNETSQWIHSLVTSLYV